MIPKKIHYCWLSEDPFPADIQRCIRSWEKHLEGYELVLWDLTRFDAESCAWVRQAFDAKKYAFAADYIRLHALYHEGGIYLDSDVEVLRPFDDLLDRPYFAGTEGGGIIEAAVLGAEAGSTWIKRCLDYYSGRNFVGEGGKLDTLTLPRIIMKQLAAAYTVQEVHPSKLSPEEQSSSIETIYLFPREFFCAKDHGSGIVMATAETYSIHHFAMSWIPRHRTILPRCKRALIRVFGVKSVERLIRVLRLRQIRSRLTRQGAAS